MNNEIKQPPFESNKIVDNQPELNNEEDNELEKWKKSQEEMRDPRKYFHHQKKYKYDFSDYKRRRKSFWDLDPSDMKKLGLSVEKVVGIPSFNANIPSFNTPGEKEEDFIKKQEKRIYVGNIPNTLSEEDLKTFFNAQMITKNLVDFNYVSSNGDNFLEDDRYPVLSCKVNYSKNFAFLDFRSKQEATNCLSLGGLKLQNNILRIRRPTDYQANFDEERYREEKRKRDRVDVSEEELAIQNILDRSIKVESAILQLQKFYDLKLQPTKIVVLMNCINIEEYVRDMDYEDLTKDVLLESSKYGTVKSIVIPRPHRDGFKSGFNKIFIEYQSVEDAKKGLEGMSGKRFSGRTVIATYHSEKDFLERKY